jgi:hypothetical protein
MFRPFGQPRPQSVPQRRATHRNSPLHVEPLEDRCLPSTLPIASADQAASIAAAFVSHAHEDLVGRPANAQRQEVWTDALADGATHSQVVAEMTRSPAYRARLVQEIYQDLLERPAGRRDLRNAVQFLAAGGTIEQLRVDLAGSPEYFRRQRTRHGFITAVFDDFLNRAPTAAERAAWSPRLLQRTWFIHGASEQTAVAEALAKTPAAKCQLVDEVFKQYLHRSASPQELGRFVHALNHGMRYERLVAKVVGAKEYFAWYKDSDPFTVNVILDQPNTAEGLIPRSGGTLTATGVDGTVFTLTIPAGALQQDTVITLTPITAIPDLPLSGGLIAGVDFKPEGLQFYQPATLTVATPTALDRRHLFGFGYTQDGEDLHLDSVFVDDATLTFYLAHFSGVGAGTGTPADANGIATGALPATEQAYQNQLQLIGDAVVASWAAANPQDYAAGVIGGLYDALNEAYLALLQAWFAAVVEPALANAPASDAAVIAAGLAYKHWFTAAQATYLGTGGITGFAFLPALNPLVVSGKEQLAAAFLKRIQAAHELCDDAKAASLWFEVELFTLEGEGGLPANSFEMQSLYTCGLVFQIDNLPDELADNEEVPFNVQVRRRLDDGTTVPVPNHKVSFDLVGNGHLEIQDTTTTNGAGFVFGTLRATADASSGNIFGKIVITVSAGSVFDDGAFPVAYGRSQEFEVLLSELTISVSPSNITLSPGDAVGFMAEVTGASNPNVNWTVSGGGTIDQDGLFTAGGTPGIFTVTATSVADPEKKAQATVTIEVPQPPPAPGHVAPTFRSSGVHVQFIDGELSPSDFEFLSDPNDFDAFTGSASVTSPVASGSAQAQHSSSLTFDPVSGSLSSMSGSGSVTVQATLETGATNPINATGSSAFSLHFTITEGPFEYTLTGSLSETGQNGQSEARLEMIPSGGIGLVLFRTTDAGGFFDSAVLQPGMYRLEVGGSAQAGPAPDAPASSTAGWSFSFVLSTAAVPSS